MNGQIITIMSRLKNWIYFGIGLSLTVWVISLVYATISYGSLWNQTTWDNLTADKWNKLYEHSVPVWFVGSFNLTSCPNWWTEYTPARWRFIRWIDSTWTNDDVRIAWDIQEDAFQWHWHLVGSPNDILRRADGTMRWTNASNTSTERSTWYGARRIVTDTVNWTPRIASETRPKNVALLFCQKN